MWALSWLVVMITTCEMIPPASLACFDVYEALGGASSKIDIVRILVERLNPHGTGFGAPQYCNM
jgi:hypothetical protein